MVRIQVAGGHFNWVPVSQDGIMGHPSLRGRNFARGIWRPEVYSSQVLALSGSQCPPLQQIRLAWAGHVDSVELAPSRHEALGLTPSIT